MPGFVAEADIEELEGSPSLRVSEDGRVSGKRVFRLRNWADIDFFILDLRGATNSTGTGTVLASRAIFPGFSNLILADIDVDAFDSGRPTGNVTTPSLVLNTYPGGAVVTATFRIFDGNDPDQPDIPGGTFLEWDTEGGSDPILIPGTAWTFSGTAKPYDANLPQAIPVGVTNHAVRWLNVPKAPRTAIRELLGHVNNATIFGVPPGCLLFQSWSRQIVPQLDGAPKYNVSYKFSEKTIAKTAAPTTIVGWNYGYSLEADANEHWFEIVANTGSSRNPFDAGDFTKLFKLTG